MNQAFYPPSLKISGGQPSNDGIRELAASRWHSPMITHRLVVSYTTFSPLPMINIIYRRLFSSAISCRHQQLLLSEVECPMLPGLSSCTIFFLMPATEPKHCFLYAKLQNKLVFHILFYDECCIIQYVSAKLSFL